jgi:hypothetical protein
LGWWGRRWLRWRRDLELVRKLPELDEPIDRLNRGMLQQVLGMSDDKQRLEWGIRMYTDASHPEIEYPELLERGLSPE